MALQILKLPVGQSPVGALLGGFQAGTKLVGGIDQDKLMSGKVQQQAIENQNLPQTLKTAQDISLAKLQGLNTSNQYQPGILAAKTQALQTQAQYGGALDSARLQGLQQNLSLAPERLQLLNQQLQQAQGRQNMYNGVGYQYSKLTQGMPAAAKAVAATRYAPQLVNAINQVFVPQQQMQTQQPQMQAQQQLSPQDQQTANQLAYASQLAANRSVTTNATNRQQEGATQVETMMNSPQYKSGLAAYAQYAGAAGKGKEYLDRWTNSNQATLVAAQSFHSQTIPIIANRIRLLDAMGATDAQTTTLNTLFSQAQEDYSSNPSRYVATMNQLSKTLNAVEASVNKSANKIFANPSINNANQNINQTVPISAQVPKIFSSQQAFLDWYKTANAQQRAQVRANAEAQEQAKKGIN